MTETMMLLQSIANRMKTVSVSTDWVTSHWVNHWPMKFLQLWVCFEKTPVVILRANYVAPYQLEIQYHKYLAYHHHHNVNYQKYTIT